MRAVVLVGGFGTRLRPLTAHTPKQMLPIVDRPMIERVVARLADHGVTDAVLSLGYRPDAFLEAYPDDTCAGVALHYAVEPEPLDTAGAIRFAALDGGIEDTFVVVNGDVLTDLDVGALWAFHQRTGAEGTIALTPVDDPSRYGVVPIDDDGRVEAFVEKPPPGTAPTNWINAGTYVLEPSVLDRIPAGRRVSIERATFPEMVADGSRSTPCTATTTGSTPARRPPTCRRSSTSSTGAGACPSRPCTRRPIVADGAEVEHCGGDGRRRGRGRAPSCATRCCCPVRWSARGAVVDGSIVGARCPRRRRRPGSPG